LGENLETVAVLELETIARARALERELKRKKNPKLAIAILQALHPALDPTWFEQPRKPSKDRRLTSPVKGSRKQALE
jgi:hypothetical protein